VALLYLTDPGSKPWPPGGDLPPVQLNDDGYYWYLYRYFEAANLDRRGGELIDLYGGRVIDGYQLHRLKHELEQALEDIANKPEFWLVLAGWRSEVPSFDTENWQEVRQSTMQLLIRAITALIDKAESSELTFVCSGD
jgi:hypothetical protein